MDLKLIADAATIVGSLSIFLTLIFVGYELKENVYQSKLANRSNRDLLHSEWLHFWSSKENSALIIRGREDFHSLSKCEQFQFEQFIADKDGLNILRARTKDFFGYPGSIICYENFKQKELIAIMWMKFIDDALKT